MNILSYVYDCKKTKTPIVITNIKYQTNTPLYIITEDELYNCLLLKMVDTPLNTVIQDEGEYLLEYISRNKILTSLTLTISCYTLDSLQKLRRMYSLYKLTLNDEVNLYPLIETLKNVPNVVDLSANIYTRNQFRCLRKNKNIKTLTIYPFLPCYIKMIAKYLRGKLVRIISFDTIKRKKVKTGTVVRRGYDESNYHYTYHWNKIILNATKSHEKQHLFYTKSLCRNALFIINKYNNADLQPMLAKINAIKAR
jgi:hypothetical protein